MRPRLLPTRAGHPTDESYSTNLVIILGMMQVSKRIPFDDPQTLLLVRAGYILSNVIIIAIYAFVHFKINKKKGMTPLISWRGTATGD